MAGKIKVPWDTEESDLRDLTVSPHRVIGQDNGPIVSEQERSNLERGLKQRHVQMIAIAGAAARLYVSLSELFGKP
jgi:amino acid permease